MFWPTPGDYNEAIQNPQYCFIDPDLKQSQPEFDTMGIPRPFSGSYASVYKLKSGHKQWAVKCFTHKVPDQLQRYEAISKHLASFSLPHTISFSFHSEGIKVKKNFYPIVKMEWIQGEPLDNYVKRNVNNPQELINLANKWLIMLEDLRNAGIAHGDLQHSNILVADSNFKLIDYDGMYVPSLAGWQSNERGNRNYQHPSREGRDFNAEIDNFSSWVVYLTFLILSVAPKIWQEVEPNGEFMIFQEKDFRFPEKSKLMTLLRNIKDTHISQLVSNFIAFKDLDVNALPRLQDFTYPYPQVGKKTLPFWLQDHLPKETVNRFITYTGEELVDLDISQVLTKLAKLKASGELAISELREIENLKPLHLPILDKSAWEYKVIKLPQRSSDYKTTALNYYDKNYQIKANLNITIFRQRALLGAYLLGTFLVLHFNTPMGIVPILFFSFIVVFCLKRFFEFIPIKEYIASLTESYQSYRQTIDEKQQLANMYEKELNNLDEQLNKVYLRFIFALKKRKELLASAKVDLNYINQLNYDIEHYPESCSVGFQLLYSSYETKAHQLKASYFDLFEQEKKEINQLHINLNKGKLTAILAISKLRKEEEEELKQIESQFNSQIKKPDDEQKNLLRLQETEKEKQLLIKKRQYLVSQTIGNAQIRGIGDVLKGRLKEQGIQNVADIIDVEQGWDNNVVIVTLTGRKKVEGIGSNKGSSLLDWKRSVEANAKISLTPLEEKSLKASYQQRYNSLMNSINLLKQESSKKKKEVNIKFAQQIERQTQFMNKEQETYFSNLSTIKEKYSKLRKQIHAELLLIPDTFSTEKEKFCQDFAHKLIKLRKLREQKREDIVVSYYKNCVEYDDKLNKIQFEFKSLKNSVDKQYWSLEKTLSGIYEHLGQDRFFLSKTQEKIDFVRSINFTDYLKLILFLPNKLNKL